MQSLIQFSNIYWRWVGVLWCCYLGLQPVTAQDTAILRTVDIPPLFQGCEDPLISPEQRQACSAPKLQAFIREHLEYPDSALARGVEGVVVIRFHVSEKGKITELRLVRDIGSGCGQEAMRVVRSMPNFTPALRNGAPIATTMTLPIRFKQPSSATNAPTVYQLEWGTAYHRDLSRKQLQNLTKRHLIVRDVYGQEHPVHFITMTVQTPNKTTMLESRGMFFSPAMRKVLKRLRPHHRLTWTVLIEYQNKPIEVTKTWTILP